MKWNNIMKSILTFFFLISCEAIATNCPFTYQSSELSDKIIEAIRSSQNCEKASELAESCSFGSSLDVDICEAAERKCGLNFWKKLSQDDKKIYNGLQRKCNIKYSKMVGTMYISMNAFCKLEIAKLYSQLYTPVLD